ncbi:MAG: hypothetical protein K9L68_06205 [Spirochaetales bacterium]|nr:hypothetical protein [Spirochaetales bacterium]MCF7938174.1 hypothetical protein [Spirochaetales bacterium]
MKRYILLLLIIVPVVFVIFGCNLNAVSIEERISMFRDALEAADASDMASHIHPDNSMKGALRTNNTWGPISIDEDNTFGSISGSGSTRTATFDDGAENYEGTFTFTMKEDEPDVWYIDRLYLDSYSDYIF